MSQNERISMPPPKVTSDGKFVCEVDNTSFDNQEEYSRHCMVAHSRSGGSKVW